MKVVLTIDIPDADEETLLEELENDIIADIQCGETEGVCGYRSPDFPGHLSGNELEKRGIKPSGTWKIEGLQDDE